MRASIQRDDNVVQRILFPRQRRSSFFSLSSSLKKLISFCEIPELAEGRDGILMARESVRERDGSLLV